MSMATETSEKRDCMFQYYDGRELVEDTGLITLAEAKGLWNKYRDDFVEKMKFYGDMRKVEMGIWIDCAHATNYHNAPDEYHLESDECFFDERGTLFKKIRVSLSL